MNYPFIMFAICAAGSESLGNSLALAAGFKGLGHAFGGEFGLGLRAIGSSDTVPTAWAHHAVIRQEAADLVDEFNGAGPYPLLNAKGIQDAAIGSAKNVVTAERFPRETHEYGFLSWIAGSGYEIISD